MRTNPVLSITALLLTVGACVESPTASKPRLAPPSLDLTTLTSEPTASRIYWADAALGSIEQARVDGSELTDLIAGLSIPEGVAIDAAAGKLYTIEAGGTHNIRRANLDGSGLEDVVGSIGPAAIALDPAGGKLYWTDAFVTGTVSRANLDGSNVEELVAFVRDREGIALDVAAGKMYWTDRSGLAGSIQRANLDGTGIEDLVTTGLIDPRGIALDIAGGKMYWTDVLAPKVQRANLDGTLVEDLVVGGIVNPVGIALDLAAEKMYWTDFGAHRIQRANLDGSGVEDVLTGLAIPVGIALEFAAAELLVSIDVKPGGDPNPINPRSQGVIPVAILTTPTFDVSSVDRASVRFGATGFEAAAVHAALEDVDQDGDLDLLIHFDTRATGIQCGDDVVLLTGGTFTGERIRGSSAIVTVGCP